MKTEYQYIEFIVVDTKTKTLIWCCTNRTTHDLLGWIRWYPGWRQYCFFPEYGIVLSSGCLRDIASFLDAANKDHSDQLTARHSAASVAVVPSPSMGEGQGEGD